MECTSETGDEGGPPLAGGCLQRSFLSQILCVTPEKIALPYRTLRRFVILQALCRQVPGVRPSFLVSWLDTQVRSATDVGFRRWAVRGASLRYSAADTPRRDRDPTSYRHQGPSPGGGPRGHPARQGCRAPLRRFPCPFPWGLF